jgi:hypothetical protein
MSNDQQAIMKQFRLFSENRNRYSPADLLPFAGQHIAWSLDGTHILASGKDLDEVETRLLAAGVDPSQVVHDYVPPLDMVLFGGLFDTPGDRDPS